MIKIMKYEKPELEELDLLLEGSFLSTTSDGKEEVPIEPGEGDGDDWD